MLSLSEIEKRHHGCFLVLRWVSLENLIGELVVLLREFKRDAGIVFRCITVLRPSILAIEELR